MESMYEKLMREIEGAGANEFAESAPAASRDEAALHDPEIPKRVNGREVWVLILAASQRVPNSLKNAFVTQVLVSIFDRLTISPEDLDEALQKAFASVQRITAARESGKRAA